MMNACTIKRNAFLRDLEDGNLIDDTPNNNIPNAIVIARARELFRPYTTDQMPVLETTKITCFLVDLLNKESQIPLVMWMLLDCLKRNVYDDSTLVELKYFCKCQCNGFQDGMREGNEIPRAQYFLILGAICQEIQLSRGFKK